MAWNQASFFLFPPRWQYRSSPVESGKPVRLVWAERCANDDARCVSFQDVCTWLMGNGFAKVVDEANVFERGKTATPFGEEKEIEVSIDVENGELTHIYCRFTVCPDSHSRTVDWDLFIRTLCKEFELVIGVDDDESSTADDFLYHLYHHAAWKIIVDGEPWPWEPQKE